MAHNYAFLPCDILHLQKVNINESLFCILVYKNCAEVYKAGKRISGVYTIDPENAGAFDVFCDQTTGGGGWTVFQKRLDGSVEFYRGWDDYKRGFGNLNGEFWLGLDKIHRLTKQRSRLRVDLEDTTGKTAYAEYDFFGVASEKSKYKLSLGTYSGTCFDLPSNRKLIGLPIFRNIFRKSVFCIYHYVSKYAKKNLLLSSFDQY